MLLSLPARSSQIKTAEIKQPVKKKKKENENKSKFTKEEKLSWLKKKERNPYF